MAVIPQAQRMRERPHVMIPLHWSALKGRRAPISGPLVHGQWTRATHPPGVVSIGDVRAMVPPNRADWHVSWSRCRSMLGRSATVPFAAAFARRPIETQDAWTRGRPGVTGW